MNQLKKYTKISIIGFSLSSALFLTGCEQEDKIAIFSRMNNITESDIQQIELLTIHVDTPDEPTHQIEQMIDEELALKQELIQNLYPEASSKLLTQFLESVSLELLMFLTEHEIQIKTADNISLSSAPNERDNLSHLRSYYQVEKNELLIKNLSDEEMESYLNEHFYHEVGHIIDIKLGDFSKTEAFEWLAAEGGELLFPRTVSENEIYHEDIGEYFAESFNLFFKNPAQLTLHDETYKYICSIIEQLSNN